MARTRRPYLPGAFFHLTARTQDKVHWFTDNAIKDLITGYIADAVAACDADLVAHAVMNNHLHLIVRQGCDPVARLMQPILRRCALLVQRSFPVDGHVFARKFRHRICRTPEDLRYCIGYVHRNPLKSGMCVDPSEYRWCSHAAYMRPANVADPHFPSLRLLIPLELYAREQHQVRYDLCKDYSMYLAEMEAASVLGATRIAFPIHGDSHWSKLCSAARFPGEGHSGYGRMDLRDVVHIGIRQLCPELDIAMVRTFKGVQMAAIRTALIERAGMAGHRSCEIARYLHVSEATVSKVLKRHRVRRQQHDSAA